MTRISTKLCDIPKKVKERVFVRDNGLCVICGRIGMPNAHYIPRSQLGLGIEQNIVTLCAKCHHNFDHTDMRYIYKDHIRCYLMAKYDDWDEKKLIYKKGTDYD